MAKEPFFGRHTIYSVNASPPTPYMTRYWIGRLRLHIFYRGDEDADCHDHPWDFRTFPLTSYVEEVVEPISYGEMLAGFSPERRLQIVEAFRWHFRPAEHTHRVLGKWGAEQRVIPDDIVPGKIVTIVWRSKVKRKWGFLKNRDGRWCWLPWKDYIYHGGKHTPCEPASNQFTSSNTSRP